MNNKVLKKLTFFLVAITLFTMYGTNIGIPGIEQYWVDFELLEMQPFEENIKYIYWRKGDGGNEKRL